MVFDFASTLAQDGVRALSEEPYAHTHHTWKKRTKAKKETSNGKTDGRTAPYTERE